MSQNQGLSFKSTNNSATCVVSGSAGSAGYDQIAEEYYDKEMHPTCAAFDCASHHLLSGFVSALSMCGKTICDVGAGRSQVAQLLSGEFGSFGSLHLVDNCEKMLKWSQIFCLDNIERHLLDAAHIDALGIEFDYIFASLGDPYNTISFLASARKSLRSSGTLAFTTPSYEWAEMFRSSDNDEEINKALFVRSNGTRHFVASHIFPETYQLRIMEESGLRVREVKYFTVSQLDLVPAKLKGLPADAPVVTLYVADKV